MILSDLIKEHGITHIVVEKGYGKTTYNRTRLTPESKALIEQLAIKWLKDQGWTTKSRKPTRDGKPQNGFISRRGKEHTKIEWKIRNNYSVGSNATLHKKTPNGGWTNGGWGRNGDLADLIKKANAIVAPILITKDTLPKAIKIGAAVSLNIDHAHKTVYAGNAWRRVRADGVVGLEKDGTVSEKKAYDPKENPWFLVTVAAHDGSNATIITDGEIMHPVKTRGKLRVTSNIPCVLNNTTDFDKKLLTMAIQTLFHQETKSEE
ncbi:MAG: hypothetical protein ACW99J_18460 [Candidatus Thorarchaeota archaeon]|jgi:hypothetical protein